MSAHLDLLRIENLSVSFRKTVVFQNINMSLQRGEWVTLLGANGAGKTTLLRTILGHFRPISGNVHVQGQSINQLSRRKLAQLVALMPQFEQRGAGLTVHDVVALGRIPHRGWFLPLTREDYQMIQEAMEASCIWELRDQKVEELSGGEWRRMLLARSIAQNATLLLLDEPTAGLDLKYQVECLRHIRYLVDQRGTAVLVSLHDLNQASAFSDKVLILGNRGLLAFGKPSQVLRPEILRVAFGTNIREHIPSDGGGSILQPVFVESRSE
ncbi:ABC transporter ATP-binding protein [Pirellulaceae bacterium SH449]